MVTLAALLFVPASAFARGGHGHGGHGHGGHGHGGHAHGHCGSFVHHAVGGHGGGHGSASPYRGPWVLVGRPFPWSPAPFAVTGGQFMQCSGQTIAPGADPQTVRRACGEPTLTQTSTQATPTGSQPVEIWSYSRPNQIIRKLRFENGVVSSIDTEHRANR